MRKTKLKGFHFLTLGFLLAVPNALSAQLVMGQYEDEAPVMTWNSYGIQTAATLGRGGTGFTIASDNSSSLFNPALLTKRPKLSISFSGAYKNASLFRFSIFNTGVFISDQNRTLGFISADLAGISGRLGKWALAVSVSGQENYRRPDLNWEYVFENQLYYTLRYKQKGTLVTTNISLARTLGDRLSVGLGLNSVKGNRESQIEERWTVSNRTITDRKSLELKGFYFNGGIVWNPAGNIYFAAVFKTPYKRKADSESLYQFSFPPADTDIQIRGEGMSVFFQPLVIGMGLNVEILKDTKIAADVCYFNWASYNVEFFGEDLLRDFKDVVKANVGFEMISKYSLFKLNFVSPLRIGIIFDPQPMKNPESVYYGLTLGAGIRFGNILSDFAYLSGKESGSGNDLTIRKIVWTVSLQTGRAK